MHRSQFRVRIAFLVLLPAVLWTGESAGLMSPVANADEVKPEERSKKPSRLRPSAPVEYRDLAMFPERWKQRGISTQLIPWEGRRVVFLTTRANFDPAIMGSFVERLDAAWKLYRDLTGHEPKPARQLKGKATIAAVPGAELTCGLGCGYIGLTGIEVAGFYDHDYGSCAANRQTFPHYYFYEMGRNYYTFGDRHSLWVTGFAVFMRYVCMDALHCKDQDLATRLQIEKVEEAYSRSSMSFVRAFTGLGGLDEKAPRVKDHQGNALNPSDQPVMYASVMLKLRRDYGGDAWVKRFFAELSRCPEIKPNTKEAALRQSFHWLVAASCAAQRNLSSVFVERWRLPLPQATCKALANIRWKNRETNAAAVLQKIPNPFKA